MPLNYVTTNGGILVPALAADPYFADVQTLFKADKGLIDLRSKSVFDTKTVPLTGLRQKFSAVSAEFDGTTSRQLISSNGTGGQVSDGTPSPNDGWTMEGFIYVPSSGTGVRAIASNQNSSTTGNFTLYIDGNNKLVFTTNVIRDTSTAAVPLNQWFSFAIAKNSNIWTGIWFNGILDSSNTGDFGGAYASAVGFAIGSRLNGTLPFNGSIDSLRITKRVRYGGNYTPAEFSDH